MTKTAAFLIVLLVLVVTPTATTVDAASVQQTRLLAGKPRQLADAAWFGGAYPTADGQHVSVFVSTRYPDPETRVQQWVAFFAGLPHGAELSRVAVYVAPLDEVQDMCGSGDVVGCYGGEEIVIPGDSSEGVAPTSIAAHEYGHHIAANRSNAPWTALDWGTKRWATVMRVCGRVAGGTAFPGDEQSNYSLNPGEAFAESYRVLVETNGTALGYSWPIVDPSFRPTAEALVALRDDVLHPWSSPATRTIHARFAGRASTWRTSITTPLDGDLRVRIDAGADDVALLAPGARTALAKSLWNSSGGKELDYRVCGERALSVRVTRGSAAARFTLRINRP